MNALSVPMDGGFLPINKNFLFPIVSSRDICGKIYILTGIISVIFCAYLRNLRESFSRRLRRFSQIVSDSRFSLGMVSITNAFSQKLFEPAENEKRIVMNALSVPMDGRFLSINKNFLFPIASSRDICGKSISLPELFQ
ncbi:MAG: hypothetical protein RLZZ28_1312 [Bacteroidota bacterium]